MITCPVCEHAQAIGDQCEVCGRKLAGPGAVPVAVAPIEGLEPTRFDGVPEGVLEVVPELEPTLYGPVDAVADMALEIEPTRAEAVAVVVDPTPDVERTHEPPAPDLAPPPPPAVVCRYCSTPAQPGEILCSRCGLRLPVYAPPRPEAAGAERAPVRCPACGTLNETEVCSGCGGRVRFPD